jgi:hypothetical protein
VSAHLREAMRQAGPAAECDVDGFRNPGARA